MSGRLGQQLSVLAVATAVAAALVSGSYLLANEWSLLGAANLYVAMFWLCLLVNLGITLAFLLFLLLVRILPVRFRLEADPQLLMGALIAGNLTWILWNRLGMAHQWATVRPFLTPTGLAQNVLLLVATLALVLATAALTRRQTGTRRPLGAVLLGTAILSYGLGYFLAVREERQHRQVDLEALQATAQRESRSAPLASSDPPTPSRRLTVLAIDGMEWSVLEPLLAAGLMPNLQGVIADGMIGYLDNFDESLSPRVWSTMATGHLPDEHGIGHFLKLVVKPTGQGFPHPPFTKPSTDYFYGVFDLALNVPGLGLWTADRQMRGDRRLASFWEVASHYGSSVGIVGGVSHLPVGEVNGFWIDMDTKLPVSATFYPAELAEIWQPSSSPDSAPRGSLPWIDEGIRFVREEFDFALELYERFDVDLAYFYTHLVDTASHINWNYWTDGRFLLSNLPITWTDEEWARSVQEHFQDPVFKGYSVVDELIGLALEGRPDSDLMIISDHGWTYSGYEHMVSPDGVVVLTGPSFQTGVVDLDVLEVAPTILAALGLPVSQAIAANARTDLLPPDRTVNIVAQFPAAALRPTSPPELVDNESEMERLRALGYIN